MMPSEFETRIGEPLPAEAWPAIHQIYLYHPEIRDVGGKDQLAQAYRTYGFERLALLMLADANAAARIAGAPPVLLELERWYGTDVIADDGHIVETRPKTLQQISTYLRASLDPLIDEYFTLSSDATAETPWPLDARWIAVFPVTGGSEGHYVHVDAIDQAGQRNGLYLIKTFRGLAHAWQIAQRLGDLLHI